MSNRRTAARGTAITPQFRLLPVLLAIAALQPALAQNNEPQVVEITAQKRSQRVQDVPLAVTAITAADLEARAIEAPSNLAGAVPTLHMTSAPGSGLIAAIGMRGLSQGQPSIWADPAVGLYVDGVFVGKNMGALFEMVDLVRIEALRGPQGTLFGRNTAAGAINFITRKPSGVFGGSAQLEVGSHGRQVGRLSVDLPKAGPVSATVAVRSEQMDGFVASGGADKFGSRDREAARVALRLEAAKGLTFDYAYDQSRIHEMPPVSSLINSRGYGELYPLTTQIGGTNFAFQNASCLARNPPVTGPCVFPSPGIGPALRQYESAAYPSAIPNGSNLGAVFQKLNLEGHTLQAELALSKTDTVRYIGSLRNMTFGEGTDLDQTPVFVFSNVREANYDTQSHELQWVGSRGGLRYVVGVYHFTDKGGQDNKQAGGLLTFHPNVPRYQQANFTIGTKAQALFGQLEFDVGNLGVGLGGRYTDEVKQVRAVRYSTNASFVQQGANTLDVAKEQGWSDFTPTLNLLYRLSPTTNLFGRVARGFKSGGFPAEAPVTASSGPDKPFDPETSTSVELGIKGSLMGNRLQYSANLFQMNVTNAQVSLLPPGSLSPTIVNAGKLQNNGLEVDASWRASDALKMTLAYGYLTAKYKKYLSTSAANAAIDAASNTVVPGAPKHTLSLTTDARLGKLGSMQVRGLADLRYVSQRYTYAGVINAAAANASVGNSAAESLMPPLTQLNLRLSLHNIKMGGPGEGELALFVKNALDQRRMVAHVDISGFYQVGTWSDPRTYGATFTYRW